MLPLAVLVVSLSAVTEAPAAPSDPDVEVPPLYVPGGRRDPFRPPGASEGRTGVCAGSGLEAFRIRSLALRGLVLTPKGRLAMLLAPDQRSYFATPGDRLCDGTIAAVTPDSVVFLERTDDPLRQPRSRSVVLRLHS